MTSDGYYEYGAWAKKIGSDDWRLFFVTPCSAQLAVNRAKEKIFEMEMFGGGAVYDAGSIVVRKRKVRIERGDWEDVAPTV